MKRTYSQRQHNRYELVRLRLVDCYGAATVYKMTHAQLLKRISEVVWESNDYKRLSQTYRAMLSECARCLSDANYRHLEWVLGTAEGPIPEGRGRHDWSTGRLSQLAQDKTLYGSHMWIGTDKLFGEWKLL
jgi:hypothetical protein